jgi:tripartite-type tricarboxylate transporter receptor subunit TctC
LVTAPERLGSAPNIPTVDDAGLPGFHVSLWTALWAPKATPKAVIAKLNAAVVEALADPTLRRRLTEELGQEIPPRDQQTPEGLYAYQKAEIEKWWPMGAPRHNCFTCAEDRTTRSPRSIHRRYR